jgi:hypothetical protein
MSKFERIFGPDFAVGFSLKNPIFSRFLDQV